MTTSVSKIAVLLYEHFEPDKTTSATQVSQISSSPATGDSRGVGMSVFFLTMAGCAAYALKNKNEK